MRKIISLIVLIVFCLPLVMGCNTLTAIGVDKTKTVEVINSTLLEYVPQAQTIVKAIQSDYNDILTAVGKSPNAKVQEYFAMADTLLSTLCQFLDQVKNGQTITLTVAQVANLIIMGQKLMTMKAALVN